MTRDEINEFIERMEEIGDVWEYEDAERVYGDRSLEDALNDRMSDMHAFANIIGMVINRNGSEQ